jgi:hypothetical protein
LGFREIEIMLLEGGAPCGVVGGHRVTQGTVAIEDVGGEIALRDFDHGGARIAAALGKGEPLEEGGAKWQKREGETEEMGLGEKFF